MRARTERLEHLERRQRPPCPPELPPGFENTAELLEAYRAMVRDQPPAAGLSLLTPQQLVDGYRRLVGWRRIRSRF